MDFKDSAQKANFASRCEFPTPMRPFAPRARIGLRRGKHGRRSGRHPWRWRGLLAEQLGPCQPTSFGGRDATPIESVIWNQEVSRYVTPDGLFIIGQGMCAPTLMAYGNDAHKAAHLPKIASGEEVWCQLFSEPVAGSDLAGIKTRAVRDGDRWIINGQKVWTSGAHYSDFGLLITRTDPSQPKHKGLTMFFRYENAGVEVRPIKQISGFKDTNGSTSQP